jgi:hypothetical protein
MADYDWTGNIIGTGDTGSNEGLSSGSWTDYLSGLGKEFAGEGGKVDLKSVLGGLGNVLGGTSSLGAAGQIGGVAGLAYLLNNMFGSKGGSGFSGYKGGIPSYTATREQNPYSTSQMVDAAGAPLKTAEGAAIPRRPGSSAINYFKPIEYTKKAADGGMMYGFPAESVLMMKEGGISSLGQYSDGGRLARGPGDGVSDSIPAIIGKDQPARIADGEFVIPARVVSELGNGSTEAGARKLYAMMDRIQKSRSKTVGKGKVAVNSKADKHLPA